MSRYPKPSDVGGTLIRRVISTFKKNATSKIKFPLTGKIAISVSGGADSMALAHLLCTYGRKVIADPKSQVTLLHFDHQWRPESATDEKKLVQDFAAQLGVAFLPIQLESPKGERASDNLEEDARLKRKAEYARLQKGRGGFKWILTAHHEDDVVETLVWRFFRGELLTHKDGIFFHHDGCLRPLLQVKKEELYAYCRAERVPFLEDPSNRSTEQLRGFFRTELFPKLESRFPGFKSSIMRYVKTKIHQENR